MSNDGHNGPGQQKSMGPGFALGLLLIAPTVGFLAIVFSEVFLVVLGLAAAGAVALLFQRDALLKGIGAGTLSGLAVGSLAVYACFQAFEDIA
jgi:hypothetical protein